MSTEFTSNTTNELAFVRWSGRRGCGVCYEFGTMTNFETVSRALRAGERFEPVGGYAMDSDPTTAEQLDALAVAGRVTFGDFPVTVEVGSGEMFRFTVENTDLTGGNA